MARFNLNGFLDNSRFEDFFAKIGGGTAGHDHLNGTTSGNALIGGRGDDDVSGMAGNDTLSGGSGADKLWGGSGNDNLSGGTGADVLVGGFGADRMDGGAGNDVLLSRSDAGEMVAAQDGTTQIFAEETAAFKAVNDTLTGGAGGDTFRFEGASTPRTTSSPSTSMPTARSTGLASPARTTPRTITGSTASATT